MDLDNIQQNMNTRVVFKEPRGMIRWLQLFFAIMAFSTVVDYNSFIGIDITCPTQIPPTPVPSSSTTPSSANSTTNVSTPAPKLQQQNITQVHIQFNITYPFNFANQKLTNTCPTATGIQYSHSGSLTGSPQLFVMTGVLSLIYASSSLVVYLFFSSTYDSIPVVPVADLIVTCLLCLFWFISSSSFSSGVSLLKSTLTYDTIKQVICQTGYTCVQNPLDTPVWRSLNIGLVSGFTSFFLWGTGIWFVYKETHFHASRDHFGPR